jgi:hypothetical protein
MSRTFRKYHRTLAIILCLPLLVTALTGMAYIILDEWLELENIAQIMLRVHYGKIFGLEKVYPLFNGLGLVGLLVTGISMTGIFRNRPKQQN